MKLIFRPVETRGCVKSSENPWCFLIFTNLRRQDDAVGKYLFFNMKTCCGLRFCDFGRGSEAKKVQWSPGDFEFGWGFLIKSDQSWGGPLWATFSLGGGSWGEDIIKRPLLKNEQVGIDSNTPLADGPANSACYAGANEQP